MRPVVAVLVFVFASACGDTVPPGGSADGGPGGPENEGSTDCAPCVARLDAESGSCNAELDTCTSNASLSTEQAIACFQTNGACLDASLRTSAACHRACGDTRRADIEVCTGACFLARADCAEAALSETDACLDTCTNDCELCSPRGQIAFDRCDDQAVACADACK